MTKITKVKHNGNELLIFFDDTDSVPTFDITEYNKIDKLVDDIKARREEITQAEIRKQESEAKINEYIEALEGIEW